MKEVKKFIKSNIKVVIAFILGILITGTTAYAATVIASKDVTYSNATSGLSATTVQGAIDELYEKAKENGTRCPEGYICNKKIVEAYTYNSSTCVTGEESTCVKTTCYKNKAAGSCKAGTIVKYFVNDSTIKYFHVLHDDGETMTMQQRENTVYNTAWYASSYNNSYGPTTILPVLENATSGWTNVNDQTYTMGTTTFLTNQYTGCSNYNYCNENIYTLRSRTAKARMITLQEAAALGCTKSDKSCPNWMNNYLYNSSSYGGTVNDDTTANGADHNWGYWTMSAYSFYKSEYAWYVSLSGYVIENGTPYTSAGARAVVVVSK